MDIVYDRNQKITGELTGNFDKDKAFIEKALDKCGDMVKNPFCFGGGNRKAFILYVDGMTDSRTVQDFVIRPMMEAEDRELLTGETTSENFLSFVETDLIQMVDWTEAVTYEDILTGILSGNSLLLVEGCRRALLLSTKDFPTRGVGETEQEMVIRGPKDSFTENFRTNTALLRRRIRDPRLKMEHTMVGERSKTDLAICYMEDLVRPGLLKEVRKRVEKISLDGILDGSMVEQLMEKNEWTPFPQFQHTERPDKAASGLLEGRIVLVVDNSPGVLILPVTYQMFFQAGDDYYSRMTVASLARLLRFAAALFAVGLPGMYVAVASFHTEMLPAKFLLPIALARTGIAIPVVAEVLLMEFQFELLKEAGIHIPGQLGSTIGIVGGLIVGQAAVDAGLVSTIVVIVVAFTAMASFIVPNESFGAVFRILKFVFIIAAALWGIYGYLLTFAALLFHLSQLESFGVPYMLPSVCGGDLDYNSRKDHYVRYPLSRMITRPYFTRPGRKLRRKTDENHETERGRQRNDEKKRRVETYHLPRPGIREGNRISRRQLTRLIYVEGFGAAGLSYPAVAALADPGEGLMAFLFYGIFLFFFTWFLLRMGRKRMECREGACGSLPGWAVLVYLVRFFLNITFLSGFFGLSIRNIYMPDQKLWWLLLPFALLLVYCAGTDLQKHGRFLELIFPWVAFLFALLIITTMTGLFTKMQGLSQLKEIFSPERLWGISAGSHRELRAAALAGFRAGYYLLLCSTPLECIYYLVPFLGSGSEDNKGRGKKAEPERNGKPVRPEPGEPDPGMAWSSVRSCVIRGVAGGYICNLFLWFVTVKTLGKKLTASTPWSVIKIMQMVHLPGGFLERLDILLAVYWILCMIGVLSGYLYYGRKMAEGGVKRRTGRAFAGIVFLIYVTACLSADSLPLARTFVLYKSRIDLPLILLLPFFISIFHDGDKPLNAFREKWRIRKKRPAAGLLLFLLVLVPLTLTGCGKQSDAEKKNYILSLYVDKEGDSYLFYPAAARLSKMEEKEALVPCGIRKIRAQSIEEMDKQLVRTESGRPEWNHIFTIFIGPGLASRPDDLIRFLEEWDAAWQKSPNVTICFSGCSIKELTGMKGVPDGCEGQQVRQLIDQQEWSGKICRTPVDILRTYYDGRKQIHVYQAVPLGSSLSVIKGQIRL